MIVRQRRLRDICLPLTLAALTGLFMTPAFAQNDQQWWTAGFYLDNDLFAGEDDGYTNGTRFSFVSPDVSNFTRDERLPPWLRKVNRQLRFFRSDEPDLRRNMVLTLGQQMYTPNERFIDETDLVEDDRPYAGWLYLGFGYMVRNQTRLETAVFNIGMVGPASYAKESQDFIHDLRGFDKFQGWDNQLRNELGIQLLYDRKNKVLKPDFGTLWSTDLISRWGGSLGNVATYLEGGLEWRFGWRLPDDFGTSSASPGGDNSAPAAASDPRIKDYLFGGVHGFVTVNGRWSIRDITLDGNTFADSHSVDKKSLVGSASMGLVILLSHWRLGFSRFFVTDEFEGQDNSRGYGSVSLSYTRAFN